jgi:flavin-dependent dehydrogenase
VKNHSNGDIASVITSDGQEVAGDLFIDCSGLQSMLLGEHLQVPFLSQHKVLFNDTAMAVQVPYQDNQDAIASCTLSTAQPGGWIWDIGLPSRRGVGHVYSSAHTTEAQAEQRLRQYLATSIGEQRAAQAQWRKLSIKPGYRQVCWEKNCIAVGMAAGFIEPLEASALALVEWTAKALSGQFPYDRAMMPVLAKRMNSNFSRHWQQIIEFLKLHYVLSHRADDDYWHDHRESSGIPDSLQELLSLWRYQVPGTQDFTFQDQLFPAASYQYVLYGMGFKTAVEPADKASLLLRAQQLFQENYRKTQLMKAQLPTNRDLLEKIKQFGLPKL